MTDSHHGEDNDENDQQREAWEGKNVYDDEEDDEGDKDDTDDETDDDTTLMKMISKERRRRAEGRSWIFPSNVFPVIK